MIYPEYRKEQVKHQNTKHHPVSWEEQKVNVN